MLEIMLPGSTKSYLLSASDELLSVETEVYHTFFPYAHFVQSPTKDTDYLIEVNQGIVKIYRNRDLVQKTEHKTIFSIYKRLISIIRSSIILSDGFCFLHGSCVSINGKSCLFLAESYSGKSTLGVYLDQTANSFCITDDLIILDTKSMQIFPISKYARLRKEGLPFCNTPLDKLKYCKLLDRYQYYLSETRFERTFIAEQIILLKSFFFSYVPPCLTLQKDARDSILQNMYLPYQIGNNLHSAEVLSTKISTHELQYSNFYDVETVLSAIF